VFQEHPQRAQKGERMAASVSQKLEDQKAVNELTYEQAYTELEKIIQTLEGDGSSLDAALTLFERGQELARYCAGLLDQAEMKVVELTQTGLADFYPQG
jgi:exodeoxyribonuclease VII small subunit